MNISDNDKRNNVTRLPNRELVKQEAGSWLVRIDSGDLSHEEQRLFQIWINQSSFHKECIEKLAKNWDSMGILSELSELFPASEVNFTSDGKDKKHRKVFAYIPQTAIAISFALIVSISSMLFYFGTNTELPEVYATTVGERAEYLLSDGTNISMNTDSNVLVDYSGDLRIVTLQKGEVTFDVAKNPNRPFVVYAGEGMVWAVGTSFNVRYTSLDVDVTVTEGIIKVFADVAKESFRPKFVTKHTKTNHPEQKEAIVEAGQRVTFRNTIGPASTIESEVIEQKLAWQKGALIFNGETLEQVIDEISRYTDKKLVIVDPKIKNIRVGGHYKTDDVNGLLDTLSKGFDIKVTKVSKDQIHLSENEWAD